MTREPVAIIGTIAAIIVAIAVQLGADGIVTGDTGKSLLHVVEVLTPVIAALVSRLFVTPTASPVLSTGTEVTTPEGTNAIVAKASPNR